MVVPHSFWGNELPLAWSYPWPRACLYEEEDLTSDPGADRWGEIPILTVTEAYLACQPRIWLLRCLSSCKEARCDVKIWHENTNTDPLPSSERQHSCWGECWRCCRSILIIHLTAKDHYEHSSLCHLKKLILVLWPLAAGSLDHKTHILTEWRYRYDEFSSKT